MQVGRSVPRPGSNELIADALEAAEIVADGGKRRVYRIAMLPIR